MKNDKPNLLHVAPEQCLPGPWFNREDLHLTPEFLADIKEHGVRQTLLVRQCEKYKDSMAAEQYEVVAGCRRLAAAIHVGLRTVPILIKDLTDREAREARITENLQRENLSALDEARQFEEALDRHEYGDRRKAVDNFANSIGRSPTYVYGRLRLLKLAEPVMQALRQGKIAVTIADLLATVPGERLQEQALEKVLEEGRTTYDPDEEWADEQEVKQKLKKEEREALQRRRESPERWREPMSFRAVKGMLNAKFRLDLAQATWELEDADLLPPAGPCTTCPKRSGAIPGMFADIKNPNLCTDPDCFAAKREAVQAARLKEKAEAGHQVMTPMEQKQAFPNAYCLGGGWMEASDSLCGRDGLLRSASQMLGKAMPPPTWGVNPDGEVKPYYRRSEVEEVASKKGLVQLTAVGKETPEEKTEREAKEVAAIFEQEVERRTVAAAVTQVVQAAERSKGTRTHALLHAMIERLFDCNYIPIALIVNRRGWKGQFEANARKLSVPQLHGLLVEVLLLIEDAYDQDYSEERIKITAKLAGVKLNWSALARAARAGLTTKLSEREGHKGKESK